MTAVTENLTKSHGFQVKMGDVLTKSGHLYFRVILRNTYVRSDVRCKTLNLYRCNIYRDN